LLSVISCCSPAWAFGGAIITAIFPIAESSDDIGLVVSGFINYIRGKEPPPKPEDEEVEADAPAAKELEEDSGDSVEKEPEIEA
jgi:hypothetical protein